MERVDAPKILHKLEERINAALPGLRVIYVSDCSRDGAVCPLLFIEQFLHALDFQPQFIFCQICMNLRIGSVVRCGWVWRLQCELHLDVLIILDKRENLEISAYLLHADASLQASFFSQ